MFARDAQEAIRKQYQGDLRRTCFFSAQVALAWRPQEDGQPPPAPGVVAARAEAACFAAPLVALGGVRDVAAVGGEVAGRRPEHAQRRTHGAP